jgi:hypothetical protein
MRDTAVFLSLKVVAGEGKEKRIWVNRLRKNKKKNSKANQDFESNNISQVIKGLLSPSLTKW